MKWLAATALTTAMVTGFFMFEAGGQIALAGPATLQLAQNSSSTTTGASNKSANQGLQPPNVTSTGPNANAPRADSSAAARNSDTGAGSAGAKGSASMSGSTSTGSAAAMSGSTSGRAGVSGSSMSSTDMSTGKSASKSKTRRSATARARSDHTNMGSAGSATRSRSTGTSRGPGGDRETAALNWLSSQGYRDIKDIHAQGNGYVATATKDGRSQTVTVDPSNGRVGPAS